MFTSLGCPFLFVISYITYIMDIDAAVDFELTANETNLIRNVLYKTVL